MTKALENITVLDLSRVLAGPSCTQMLGDLGAKIIKVERPFEGDDTRKWGPPFLKDSSGKETEESAYYLSANRNKKSIAIDITTDDGQTLVKELVLKSDILIENFKTGGLKKYGLDYNALRKINPRLIYCSITGFGQTGPLAREPGYDFLAQAMGGLMAITGEPDGQPMKAGVALSDILTGLYAATGILAALNARHITGEGQHIDLSLVDCTMAAMTNIAQYYLTSGNLAPRLGNAHSTIVPYQQFQTKDGYIIIAVGNDRQFARLCHGLECGELSADARFATNRARVQNRAEIVDILSRKITAQTTAHWIKIMDENDVPAAPVQTMKEAFEHPQSIAREMIVKMPHEQTGEDINLVASPLKLSRTPVSYETAPPPCGFHTKQILKDVLGMNDSEIDTLFQLKIVA